MATSAEGVTLIAFLGLALGLTFMAYQVRMLPYSFGASIAWLVPIMALATGVLGPGIAVLWVQGLCLVFLLMAFAPLLHQMRTEVRHEKRMDHLGTFNWSSYQKRGWTPENMIDTSTAFKNNLKEITERAQKTRRTIHRARVNQPDKARRTLSDF